MSEFTHVREAVHTLASRSPAPDFSELKRRATRRGRRRVVTVAAVAVVIAGLVPAITSLDHDRQSSPPVELPTPSFTAERVIADGHLHARGGHGSGAVLTVWTTCESYDATDCPYAWRLGTGGRALATGLVTWGVAPRAYTAVQMRVDAGQDGFLIEDLGHDVVPIIVGLDGTATPLPECRPGVPPLEPGRLVWDGRAVDTAGVYCPTQFGGGDNYEGVPQARFLSGAGAFTGNGHLWALVENGLYETPSLNEPWLTIGTFDGSRWHHRRLAQEAPAQESLVAAAGSKVVVVSRAGISVTTDDGATWREVTDPTVLERDLPFLSIDPANGCCGGSMAFAGPSTLYVTDSGGGLWRSTDLATFHQVVARPLRDLQVSGDSILAQEADSDDLFRIATDGRVEHLTIR